MIFVINTLEVKSIPAIILMIMSLIYIKDSLRTSIKNMHFYYVIFFALAIIFNSSYAQEAICLPAKDDTRVVIAGGSITEIFYLLGIEDRIVALDITSNYPEEAKKFPSVGYVRMLSAEGLLSMNPTIILGENDMGPPTVIKQVRETGVELRIIPEKKSVQGIIEKIRCVAETMGVSSLAEELINHEYIEKYSQIKQNQDKVLRKNISAMVIYSMQGTSPIVCGTGESGDAFLKLIGAENAFSAFEGWKPASAESILANDPDYIIITSRLLKRFSSIEELKNHPSLSQTTAAQNDNIIAKDGMAMMGFGPRTIDCALEVSKIISSE